MSKKMLTKEAIRKADDGKAEVVDVPEWGGSVTIKGLSGSERDAYEASILQARKDGSMVPNLQNARAKLVLMSAVDEEGKLLFSNEDISWLGSKSARALQRCFDKARELAGLKDEDIEELLGNSEDAQSGGSTSG